MGDETVSFVFFDGRFWIALIERRRDGKLSIARHVFGAEPTNPELKQFYVHGVQRLCFVDAPPGYRPPKAERLPEAGTAKSSLDRFKEALRERAEAAKGERSEKRRLDEKEAFALKQEKRKKKQRGH
jgi:hypothetical protein